MDAAVSTAIPERLEPGKELVVPLKALFNDDILGIDTSTKKQAQITVDYRVGNDAKQAKLNQAVNLEGRNGMNWIDDRRAAAFVTHKDPPIVVWAKNIWSAVQGEGSTTIDENLRKTMAIHEAVRLHKMVYSKDPHDTLHGIGRAEGRGRLPAVPTRNAAVQGGRLRRPLNPLLLVARVARRGNRVHHGTRAHLRRHRPLGHARPGSRSVQASRRPDPDAGQGLGAGRDHETRQGRRLRRGMGDWCERMVRRAVEEGRSVDTRARRAAGVRLGKPAEGHQPAARSCRPPPTC